MASRNPEANPKALLGDLLREARRLSKYDSQEAVANALGVERSTIGKSEQGDRVPNAHTLERWLNLLQVSGLARKAIEGAARLARFQDDGSPVKIWFSGYLSAEATASAVRIWQPVIVPGLVQTNAYAHAVFEAAGIDDTRIKELIDVRLKRQDIFMRPEPASVVILLDRSALYRQLGTPQDMRDQMDRLITLSRTIVVQVVPSCNAGLGGAISLLTTPGGPEMLLAEALIEDQMTTEPGRVGLATATFDAVRGDAFPRTESRNQIMEARETWNGR